jgi:hydrogenase expression/formation protein HypC
MCLGIPGKIVEILDDEGLTMGVVDFGGARREVCLAYVADDASVGDYVIVHVGFALSIVDEAEAMRSYEILRMMSETEGIEPKDRVAEPPPNPAKTEAEKP